MKKLLLLMFVVLLNACATVNIYEFEDMMTEREKFIFLFEPLIYSDSFNYIKLPDSICKSSIIKGSPRPASDNFKN